MPSTTLIANQDRLTAGFTNGRRIEATTWGAMSASGGRLVRTVDGDVQVLATVGHNAAPLAKVLSRIDLCPASFLHDLAEELDGAAVDMPRLVRDLLAGRAVTAPDCFTVKTLQSVATMLADAKPGAAAAVTEVITTSLDRFGPTLVPAQVNWFVDEDYHTQSAWVELSPALAALEAGDVVDLLDQLHDLGSATLPSGAIATLSDWDVEFGQQMRDANWETVEVIADEQTIRILTDVVNRECPQDPYTRD